MAKIIFTSRYIKNATANQTKNLVNYMATRPGAEILSENAHAKPVTVRQKQFIDRELKKHPELKKFFEYEEFLKSPSLASASKLISTIAENSSDLSGDDLKNYINYIAHRPKAERLAQGHGLWNGSNQPIDLEKAAKEVANHRGNIWTHVISLRREDAERLNYDNAAVWRELVKQMLPIIAENMNIPLDKLTWYGAYHDMGHHPHIHLLVYSQDHRKKGYLTEVGIDKLRHTFGNAIFHDDHMHIYTQKDEARAKLNEKAELQIKSLLDQINNQDISNSTVPSNIVVDTIIH